MHFSVSLVVKLVSCFNVLAVVLPLDSFKRVVTLINLLSNYPKISLLSVQDSIVVFLFCLLLVLSMISWIHFVPPYLSSVRIWLGNNEKLLKSSEPSDTSFSLMKEVVLTFSVLLYTELFALFYCIVEHAFILNF